MRSRLVGSRRRGAPQRSNKRHPAQCSSAADCWGAGGAARRGKPTAPCARGRKAECGVHAIAKMTKKGGGREDGRKGGKEVLCQLTSIRALARLDSEQFRCCLLRISYDAALPPHHSAHPPALMSRKHPTCRDFRAFRARARCALPHTRATPPSCSACTPLPHTTRATPPPPLSCPACAHHPPPPAVWWPGSWTCPSAAPR